MQLAAVSPLTDWANFYVIIGSSAGALTGLTFVVISLIGENREQGTSWGLGAFTTPTVVHFGAVLLVSATLSAPWPALLPAGLMLGLSGLGGVAYAVIVVRRLRRRVAYTPVREDWLWYAVFPLAAYTILVVAGIMLPGNPVLALFSVAAVMVLLLFTGIHNAWDTVTYLAVERFQQQDERKDEG